MKSCLLEAAGWRLKSRASGDRFGFGRWDARAELHSGLVGSIVISEKFRFRAKCDDVQQKSRNTQHPDIERLQDLTIEKSPTRTGV